MKKRLLSLLSLLLVPVLLTGCWQEEPLTDEDLGLIPVEEEEDASPTTGKTILPEVFSLPYAPDQTLDPVTCPDGMQQVVGSLLYEGLFRLGHDLEPEPRLCSDYTYDRDALRYVFTLRPGVTFSDGSPLTAADVKATLDRARNSDRYRARLAQVSSVSAGDNTVTVDLDRPNSGFPALLDIPIVKKDSGKDGVPPLGTGPYFFSDEAEGACLVSNQTWWQGGQPTERIRLVDAADRDTMLYRFTSHEVQLVTADLTGTTPITATGNVSFQDADTTILHYLGFNTAKAPLDNAALRAALWAGIDRDRVVSAFLSGHGDAAQFPVSPVSPLYPAELEQRYAYDGFAAALSGSGVTVSRTLALLVNEENGFKVSAAEYLAETFTAAGVPTKVRALPWEAYLAALAAGDFDLYYGEAKLSADWDLSALLGTGGALNYGGWADARTDALLASCAGAADRAAAMKALCQHLRRQAPIAPICFKSTSVLMQDDALDGLAPTMAEPFYDLPSCVIHLRKK